jgi:hypothetical protein
LPLKLTKEEREERKRVALERIEESNRCIWLYPESEVEQVDKALTQVHDLSILPVNKQIAEVQERYDEVKLGLEIAHKVAYMELPELGLTYKELAFELLPEARTKSDQELEPYIQRIVKAIDAVQIHILTRFFRKTIIRIFPIALPSKVDNVEPVFNGYKKKYVDKVLREFITI